MIDRAAIYPAFWVRLEAATGFVTKSRTLKHWDDVPAGAQPALFMSQRREQAIKETGKPTRWRLMGDLYIYVRSLDADAVAADLLNASIDAVCARLAPDQIGSGKCTLGGLVHDARIEGEIETDEGTLGQQAVAILPYVILVQD